MIKQTTSGRPTINTGSPNLNNAGDPVPLAGGTDGSPAVAGGKLFSKEDFTGGDQDPTLPSALASAASQNKTGLTGLGDVDEISLLCCPEESYLPAKVIAGLLTTLCENMKDRFAILQAPPTVTSLNDPSANSKYAAYYYPWLAFPC